MSLLLLVGVGGSPEARIQGLGHPAGAAVQPATQKVCDLSNTLRTEFNTGLMTEKHGGVESMGVS